MTSDIDKLHKAFLYKIETNGGVECETMPDVFFPEGTEANKRFDEVTAKIICQECPLSLDCLEYAIKSEQEYGIWGGTTPEERKLIRRKNRTPSNWVVYESIYQRTSSSSQPQSSS